MPGSLLVLSLLALLSGCGLGGANVPETHFYRLPAISLPVQPQQFSQLVIRPVQANGLYHERAMLYAEQSQPLQLQRYHYHLWAEKPAELVGRALYQGLHSSGIAAQISQGLLQPEQAVYIDTRIEQFERLILDNGVKVQVALQFTLHGPDNGPANGTYDLVKTYSAEVSLPGLGMHDSAAAFGEALQQIMQQLVANLLLKKQAVNTGQVF
ncbi:MAG TPA: ABC-type transport auxiliary lipoprotein family protein [Gammaproteobacteria bacterium]